MFIQAIESISRQVFRVSLKLDFLCIFAFTLLKILFEIGLSRVRFYGLVC